MPGRPKSILTCPVIEHSGYPHQQSLPVGKAFCFSLDEAEACRDNADLSTNNPLPKHVAFLPGPDPESRTSRLATPLVHSLAGTSGPPAFCPAGKRRNSLSPNPDILRALYDTGPADVKVVILGQDPYHGAGEACGLAFAVRRGIRIPPSLRNIYRELEDSLDISLPAHGDLSAWSHQGVLLLNTVLTVAADQAASHRSLGCRP